MKIEYSREINQLLRNCEDIEEYYITCYNKGILSMEDFKTLIADVMKIKLKILETTTNYSLSILKENI